MAGQNRSGSRKQSGKVAFCGMMVALSVALMLTGGLVPIATYCAPMLGGILLLPIMLEYGRKTAWTAYIATSLIVLTLGVDKEAAFFYLFLGYYPIIKWNIEKIGKKPLRLALKLVVFNAAIFLMYAILGFVLHMDAVVAEFTEMGAWLLFLFAVLMATLFLPQVVLNIPQFLMYRQFGWVDSPYYLALIMPTLFAQETYFVYMLIQFMRNIPRELDEAAKIDGCNIMQTLVLVLVPMLWPAMVSAGLFQFMWSSNDFMGPLLYVNSPARYPATLFVRMSMDADTGFAWNRVMAVSLISIIPSLVVFFLAQRQFMDGVTAGAVKG